MDKQQILDKIAILQKAKKSLATKAAKEKLKSKIADLKQILKDANIPTGKLATMLIGSEKKIAGYSKDQFGSVLKRLSARDEYSFLKSMGKGKVKDDMKRFAKPVGWRFKGKNNIKKPTAKELAIGKKNGTVYYEDRANRSDVVRRAKLKTGGSVDDKNRIAKEIITQLGGMGKMTAMTGAYNFVSSPNGVSFRIKNPKANYIKIILNGMDLYDLEVWRIRGDKYTIVADEKGLYFDMLKPAIEKATGMYLSLFGEPIAAKSNNYKLGDKFHNDFDYDGMVEMGLKANVSWGVDKLTKLYESFVDVNYHTESKPLWEAIKYLKNERDSLAKLQIIEFHNILKA